jgi:hypothetical protein
MQVIEAPYPAETRAKGWRFELAYEQIEQSSTWALAGAEARPWLLMLWMIAWRQVPCGSLPSEPEVIAALIGITPKAWHKHQSVLMRGWQIADDGRLYHKTITERVFEMIGRRRSGADRKSRERARKSTGNTRDALDVSPMSRVTHAGLHPDSSTDNRIPNTEYQIQGVSVALADVPGASVRAPPTPLEVFVAMRTTGLADGHAGHPDLIALVGSGATVPEFQAAAAKAVEKGKGFAYAVAVLKGQRIEAANAAKSMISGPLPNKQQALEIRNRAVGAEWLAREGEK